MAAAKIAYEKGVEWIEIDVQKSRDGIFYIFHDPGLSRTSNGAGLLSASTSKYIDSLDAGSWFSKEFAGEKIPRLETFLEWAKGKVQVFFDLKTLDVDGVVSIIKKYEFEKDCMVWSMHKSKLRQIAKKYPEIPIKLNKTINVKDFDSIKPKYYEVTLQNVTQQDYEECEKRGIHMMFLDMNTGPHMVEKFKEILKLEPWGCNLDDLASFIKAKEELKDEGVANE